MRSHSVMYHQHHLPLKSARLQSFPKGVPPDAVNRSIRKFLREVGVTSLRKIEEAVRELQASGSTLIVRMTLTAEETAFARIGGGTGRVFRVRPN
jgi:hypothetical protein